MANSPPYYILFSQSSLSNLSPSSNLGHPIVQYHYEDDSPLALLPRAPGEHVLVLDYTGSLSQTLTASSLSRDIAVTGLKVEDAPGAAAAAADDGEAKNGKMHIIEMTSMQGSSDNDYPSPQSILAQFKQRNIVLRKALAYSSITSHSTTSLVSPPSTSPTTINH